MATGFTHALSMPRWASRASRMPTRCPATLASPGGLSPVVAATIVNLSSTGLRLLAPLGLGPELGPRSRVQLSAVLPFSRGDFSAVAEIVWSKPREGDTQLGLRFLEVEPQSKLRLLGLLEARPVRALFIGCGDPGPELLAALEEEHVHASFVTSDYDGMSVLELEEVGVLVLGSGLSPERSLSILEEAYARWPELQAPAIVFNGGADYSLFSELVTSGRLYFLTQRMPPASETVAIVLGGVDRYWVNVRREETTVDVYQGVDVEVLDRALQISGDAARLSDPNELCAVVEEAVRELTGADRSYCLLHDPDEETLWAPSAQGEDRELSTAAGLVSYAARTAAVVHVARAADDPRYDRDADDPDGDGSEQLLIQPVLLTERRVAGALVAVRRRRRDPLAKPEKDGLRVLALQLSATFGRVLTQLQIERVRANEDVAEHKQSPFNAEALLEHLRAQGEVGHLLRLHSPWIDHALTMLGVFVLLVVAFLLLGRVNHYGKGHAIVHLQRKTTVTARAQGVVTDVQAGIGDRVAAGAVLAVLDDSRERTELRRLERDLRQPLIRWLRDPSDSLAGRQLAELRAQREAAVSNLATRTVVAHVAGRVNDVRVAPGQLVAPGDTVFSLSETDSAAYGVLAVFPGRYRPQTRLGAPLRLEFVGFPFAYLTAPLAAVGEEVVGPREARRMLGVEHEGSIPIEGPVFVAKADLPGDGFLLDGVRYGFFDGLVASAEVRLRAEPILFILVPGLRRFFDGLEAP